MRTFSCSSLNSVNVSSKTLLGFLYQTSHPPGRGRRLRKPPRRWGWLCLCPVSPSGRHRPTSCQRRTLRKQRAPWLVHGLCASSGWKRGIKESERSCADQHHFATDCQIKKLTHPEVWHQLLIQSLLQEVRTDLQHRTLTHENIKASL